ncbi:MAG: RluA family pseudouridine synthase [Bacteroidales bacterium]|nr:RluA family pseudouridine synthase [Bacteroidales bacterium]
MKLEVIYEDNHIIAINKSASDIVQGDKTGDTPLLDYVKEYIKLKYQKPGNVFLGLPHRLDRPTSGIVLFARTSKALSRLNDMFKDKDIKKIYWAIVSPSPEKPEADLEHFLSRNEKQNKSYVFDEEKPQSKRALLHYKTIAKSDLYTLLEVELKTGRHHQIRAQLAHIGCPIKGDLKYGARRSNPDKGICLHARSIQFSHPTTKQMIYIEAPVPDTKLWKYFEQNLNEG